MRFISGLIVLVVVGLFLWALASQTPWQEQLEKFQASLPQGCIVKDLGSFSGVNDVIMINCDGKNVTTTTTQKMTGKITQRDTTVTIN